MCPFQKILILAVAYISFSGCISPIQHEMTTEFPASVLYAVGTPPVRDGRAHFRDIFCKLLAAEPDYQGKAGACEDFLLRFNDEPPSDGLPEPLSTIRRIRYRVMIVPGFFNECFADIALPFEKSAESLNDPRFKIDELIVSGRSSSNSNAEYIAATIDTLDLEGDEKLVLIGHSKGAVDILHYLVNYPNASQRIAAVVSVAGAINGSPIAARLSGIYASLASYLVFGKCDAGDGGAMNSLKPAVRMSWLAANPLPESVHYFSLAACTRRDNINMLLKPGYDLLWIDSPRNDGLLLACDQIIPGGTLLGYANADHWSVALPLENKHLLISETVQAPKKFPRKVLLHAILVYVAETLESKQG
jgi:pimeloyl-ACP methyl ester carboxylesterase